MTAATLALPPLILDFDASVSPLKENEIRLDLRAWQEAIRFGCARRAFARLGNELRAAWPQKYGCAFLGSGDYHHVSLILLQELAARRGLAPAALDLVVCDNHPDNMRYPFGIHCGSWVSWAAALPFILHIHLLGVTSPDIGWAHAWENRLAPFWRNKLTYWSVGRPAPWLRLLNRAAANKNFAAPDELLTNLLPCLAKMPAVYLSIDKDALSPDTAKTTWDQGVLQQEHVEAIIGACKGKLLGADICGEASQYAYAGWFKRFLSRLDGQTLLAKEQLDAWRPRQHELNRRLLALINQAWG